MARFGLTRRAMSSAPRSGAGVDAPFATAPHGAGPGTTIPVGAMFGLLSMPHGDAILSVVLALLLVAPVGGLVYAFWREVRNATMFVEPIEVPHELARSGFSPAVVAARLLDDPRKFRRWAATLDALGRGGDATAKRTNADEIAPRNHAPARRAWKP